MCYLVLWRNGNIYIHVEDNMQTVTKQQWVRACAVDVSEEITKLPLKNLHTINVQNEDLKYHRVCFRNIIYTCIYLFF